MIGAKRAGAREITPPPPPLFSTNTKERSCSKLRVRYCGDFKPNDDFSLKIVQFEELPTEETSKASEPYVSKPKLGLFSIQIAGCSNSYGQFSRFASILFLASLVAFLPSCSSPNKDSFRPHLYLGVTSNYSDSSATLEPRYFVPDCGLGGGGNWGAGWMIGRGNAVQVGAPAGNLATNSYSLLNDASRDLSSKTSGVGFGTIIGLEMKVFKLRMSLEADCSTLGYGKNKQRDDLFENFSFGLSYRLGLKLGNYFTPYLLAGMEFNTFRARGENFHFQENTPVRYIDILGAVSITPSESCFYNLDSGKIIQSPRLGCGFEISFFERFKFRFDCLWALRRRVCCNFETQTTLSAPKNIAGGLRRQVGAEDTMNLFHKKFSTRFGIIMDL